MEEAVVYPGKLPIVCGNSLWETVPWEQGSAQREELTAELLAKDWLVCIHWDLMLGVRRPPHGTRNDGEVETTKGEKGKDRQKIKKEGKRTRKR